jgi:hypothetical protein
MYKRVSQPILARAQFIEKRFVQDFIVITTKGIPWEQGAYYIILF